MFNKNNERLSGRALMVSAHREPGILHDTYNRF